MKDEDFFAGSLIIAEITGSITDEERKVLNYLRASQPQVVTLSEFMHKVLDPKLDEILPARTSAADIIKKGNAHLINKLRCCIDRALTYFEK